MLLPPLAGIIGMAVAIAVVVFGFRLHNRYRAAIEYSGIGRPYPIGNSILAFLGFAMMLFGTIAGGVIAMVTFVWHVN
jgi:hypothetical protein